jgi:hypothetical protein
MRWVGAVLLQAAALSQRFSQRYTLTFDQVANRDGPVLPPLTILSWLDRSRASQIGWLIWIEQRPGNSV